MASEGMIAMLNLLSGGTQGFAESRRKKQEQIMKQKELDRNQSNTQKQLSLQEDQQVEEGDYRSKVLAGQAESERATAAYRAQTATDEAAYREKDLGIKETMAENDKSLEKLELQLAALKTEMANNENTFDPIKFIGQASAAVHAKWNTPEGDPAVAGKMAAQSAADLLAIFRTLGLMPTPAPPPKTPDEVISPDLSGETLTGEGLGLGYQPFLVLENIKRKDKKRVALLKRFRETIGKPGHKDVQDSLRTLRSGK